MPGSLTSKCTLTDHTPTPTPEGTVLLQHHMRYLVCLPVHCQVGGGWGSQKGPGWRWCSPSAASDSCDPIDSSPPDSCVHGDSPGKNTGVGCHFLLQGIFLTPQESNLGLLHCRRILYQLSYEGSPRTSLNFLYSLDSSLISC